MIGARSRSFRAIVRADRAPAGACRCRRGGASGRSRSTSATRSPTSPPRPTPTASADSAFDIAGPEVLSYAAMIERIAAAAAAGAPDAAPAARAGSARPAHSRRASAASRSELLAPLMRSLERRPAGRRRAPRRRRSRCRCTASTRRSSTHCASGRSSSGGAPRDRRPQLGRRSPRRPQQVWAVVMDPRRPARVGDDSPRAARALAADPPREGRRWNRSSTCAAPTSACSWLLVECREPHYARWEGRGPARSIAHIEYRLTAVDDGTRFDYQNEFRPPLGAVGALASRTVMGQAPQREADRSLAALRRLVECRAGLSDDARTRPSILSTDARLANTPPAGRRCSVTARCSPRPHSPRRRRRPRATRPCSHSWQRKPETRSASRPPRSTRPTTMSAHARQRVAPAGLLSGSQGQVPGGLAATRRNQARVHQTR